MIGQHLYLLCYFCVKKSVQFYWTWALEQLKTSFTIMCDPPYVRSSRHSACIWLASHSLWSTDKKHLWPFIGNSMIGLNEFSWIKTLSSLHQLNNKQIPMESKQHFVHGPVLIWNFTLKKNVSEQALTHHHILRLGLMHVCILMWVLLRIFMKFS